VSDRLAFVTDHHPALEAVAVEPSVGMCVARTPVARLIATDFQQTLQEEVAWQGVRPGRREFERLPTDGTRHALLPAALVLPVPEIFEALEAERVEARQHLGILHFADTDRTRG